MSVAITQNELTDLFEYGIDLKNRRIYFGHMSADPDTATEFNSISVEIAIRALHKMVADSSNKSIELHLSSFGGSVYDALRLHDEILACNTQIKFYGGGAIMSSATIIMVACDERYLYPNARIMLHELSDSGENLRHSDIKINAQENENLHKIMCRIYANNSRLPIDFWNDILSKDIYISPDEAISMGLSDFIVESKKRGNLRKKRQVQFKKEIDLKKLVKELYDRTGRTRIPRIELNQFKKEESDPNLKVEDIVKKVDIIEEVKPNLS
jgi:ATP-dependent Clp protease protease subunit